MKDRGSHVVPLASVARESLDGGESLRQEVKGGRRRMQGTNVAQTFDAKFLVMRIACFGQAIRAEEQRIARLELKTVFLVTDIGEKAGR